MKHIRYLLYALLLASLLAGAAPKNILVSHSKTQPFRTDMSAIPFQAVSPLILVMDANGPVSAGMAEYLRRSIETASKSPSEGGEGASALVVRLNTLGGAVEITYQMIEMIRSSPVPVIVYVAPPGAIAASAGTLLTMAGHAAAMAPETAIGAASPVAMGGEELDSTSARKSREAIKATIRTLMEGRRPPKAITLAEATIDFAVGITSQEALSAGMVDAVAADLGDLARQLDGLVVQLDSGPVTLQTANAIFKEVEPTPIEQFLQLLTNPNIVFSLLSIGLLALLVEMATPGGWVAGFFGVISVTVAAFGLGALGVNWVGLVFMVAAFALFVLEFKAPTHGALTIAGVTSFIVGGLVLFNSPGAQEYARVSVPLVVGAGMGLGLVFFAIFTFALRSLRTPVRTGKETLAGRQGHVVVALAPKGIVQVAGEQWSAELEDRTGSLAEHAAVEVVRVEGLHLFVRPVK